MSSRPYIGGQAVLEGVMMRAPKSFAVVVRRADGSLHVREHAMASPSRAARWPLVRGVFSLVESLRMGSEALRFSVEQMEADLGMRSSGIGGGAGPIGAIGALGLSLIAFSTGPDANQTPRAAPKNQHGSGWVMLVLMIGFLVALPQGIAALLSRAFGLGLAVQSAEFQAITGCLKLAIVLGYLLAIRRIAEIRRVFQYHGAEHKTISTYEAGEALTVENARRKTTLHPRCGTTFLVMVVLVSVVVFSLVGAMLPKIRTGSAVLDNVLFFAEKLPFLPLLVAVTFELQRFLARYCSVGPMRALLWPGFLVQRITTAEPNDGQLEVALASLRATLFRQQKDDVEESAAEARFPSYEALVSAPSLHSAAG